MLVDVNSSGLIAVRKKRHRFPLRRIFFATLISRSSRCPTTSLVFIITVTLYSSLTTPVRAWASGLLVIRSFMPLLRSHGLVILINPQEFRPICKENVPWTSQSSSFSLSEEYRTSHNRGSTQVAAVGQRSPADIMIFWLLIARIFWKIDQWYHYLEVHILLVSMDSKLEVSGHQIRKAEVHSLYRKRRTLTERGCIRIFQLYRPHTTTKYKLVIADA